MENMRHLFLPVLTLIFVLFTVQLGYQRISDKVDGLLLPVEARRVAADFIDNGQEYVAEQTFCADPRAGHICRMVALTVYDNLGKHAPLWAFLDAMMQVGSADMPHATRMQYHRLYGELNAVLNRYGAVEHLSVQRPSEWASATLLYVAILSQADACRMLPEVACVNGLPVPLNKVLRRMADFLDRNRPLAVYHLGIRAPAIRTVTENL